MEMSTEKLLSKEESILNKLVLNIKNKKELKSLDDDFILNLVRENIDEKILEKLKEHSHLEKSKDFKKATKEIRKILHETYGVFQLDPRKVKLLKELKEKSKESSLNDLVKIHETILNCHRSTKERLSYYNLIYSKILNKDVKSILDISSGLNPFSFVFMKLDKVNYIATELSKEDCNFLNDYFKIMKKFGLNGKAEQLNLLKVKDFPEADITFLLKTLDSLETLEKDISKKILSKINSKVIVVSFPTKTLSGKELSKNRLGWFEKLIENFEVFEVENEIFYVIKKKIY